VDKLFDGIRWLTTRIYQAGYTLINGFWRLVRLTGLLVLACCHCLYEIVRAIGKWPRYEKALKSRYEEALLDIFCHLQAKN